MKTDLEFIKQIELIEAEYWNDYFIKSSEEVKKEPRLDSVKLGSTYCCSAANEDILVFNRALYAGIESPVTKAHLQEIIKYFRNAGSKRFFVQVSPAAMPADFEKILIEAGFTHYNNWSKLYMPLKDVSPQITENLEVRHIMPEEKGSFGEVIEQAFGFSNGLQKMFTQTYNHPGWYHYLVFDNGKPIAAATMYIKGKFASLAIAGTIAEGRNKGAQTALINARINDAIEAGCEYMVVETAEDKPESPVISYKNMIRRGFKLAYLRPSYIYEF